MKKTREQIITSMCLTYRHDFGFDKDETQIISDGVTAEEKQFIWKLMSQIFDNDIAPSMEFKDE